MNIGIVLVHNKTDQENIDQINNLKALLTEVVDGPFLNKETGETWTTIHHEIIGLSFPHQVKVYQIIPFGVTPPPNRDKVNSGGMVYYGKGDEDKTGDHPRFFNWGLKRGTDNGGEIVVNIEDMKKFDVDDLAVELNSLIDPDDKHEFIEDPSSKIATLNLLKTIGQLDETKARAEAIADLKERVSRKGLISG